MFFNNSILSPIFKMSTYTQIVQASLRYLLLMIYPFCSLAQSKSEYYNTPIDTILVSKALNRNEEITIILPRAYNKNKFSKYPVIVVFDRQNQKEFREIYESINYLVSFDGMPESIIVGIKSDNFHSRYLETSFLSSNKNAQGEQMVGFIYDELIPWLDANFNTNKNRIFIGHSRFGYFSSYLLQNKLTDLTGVISCSPFFTETNVNLVDSLKEKLQQKKLNHVVYYRFITGDSVSDTKDYSLMKSYLSTEQVRNFNWKGMEFYSANHFLTPGLSVMPSLLEIFGYWNEELNKIFTNDSLPFKQDDYSAFMAKMESHYGDKLGLGLAQLNGLGFRFYNNKKYGAARQTWEIMLKEFPMFTEGYVSVAKSYKKEGNNNKAIKNCDKAVQQLNATTFYSSEEKQELVKEIEELRTAKD